MNCGDKVRNFLFPCLALFSLLFVIKPAKDKFIKIYLPDGFGVTTELALTDEERQRGLMYREKMNPDQGMLFIFEEEGYYSFWMANMKLPLDILWLDKERRIVHIEKRVPPCRQFPCPSYSPKSPARYVLELVEGTADEHKLRLYDRLEFILGSPMKRRVNPLNKGF